MFLLIRPCGYFANDGTIVGHTTGAPKLVELTADTVEPTLTEEEMGSASNNLMPAFASWMMDYACKTFLHKPAIWRQLQEQSDDGCVVDTFSSRSLSRTLNNYKGIMVAGCNKAIRLTQLKQEFLDSLDALCG